MMRYLQGAGGFHGASETTLQGINEAAAAFSTAVAAVRAITPAQVENGTGGIAANALVQAADALGHAAMPVVAYLSTRDTTQVEEAAGKLREYGNEAQTRAAEIATALNRIEAQEADATKMPSEIRKISGEVGVAAHTKEFSQLAIDHGEAAGKWLGATALLGFASAVAIWCSMLHDVLNDNAHTATIVQHVMWRAVLFAVASFLTVWAARNYRAHRHLYILNQHRSTALHTFRTFVNASRDDATRDAVLLEATRCIFTAGSTGYSSEEPAGPADRLIEIVKTVKGSG